MHDFLKGEKMNSLLIELSWQDLIVLMSKISLIWIWCLCLFSISISVVVNIIYDKLIALLLSMKGETKDGNST